MDCSPPGSSVNGILQARIPEGVAISFSRGSFQPRDGTWVSCIGRQIVYCRATGEALLTLLLFSHSGVRLFATPWTIATQASLSFTITWNLIKFMSIELMPSNHIILSHPLLLLPSIFPSIRVFYNESALCIRWPSTGVTKESDMT